MKCPLDSSEPAARESLRRTRNTVCIVEREHLAQPPSHPNRWCLARSLDNLTSVISGELIQLVHEDERGNRAAGS
jgi:hypothetical protein